MQFNNKNLASNDSNNKKKFLEEDYNKSSIEDLTSSAGQWSAHSSFSFSEPVFCSFQELCPWILKHGSWPCILASVNPGPTYSRACNQTFQAEQPMISKDSQQMSVKKTRRIKNWSSIQATEVIFH